MEAPVWEPTCSSSRRITGMTEAKLAIKAARSERVAGLPVIVMVTVERAGQLPGRNDSAEEAAKHDDRVGRRRRWLQLQRGSGDGAGGDRTYAQGNEAAAWPPCRMQALRRSIDGSPVCISPRRSTWQVLQRSSSKRARTFVGGCCGTTPQYTRAMRGALRALEAQSDRRRGGGVRRCASRRKGRVRWTPPPMKDRSKVGAMIAAGQFCTLVEIVPPKGFDCSKRDRRSRRPASPWSGRNQHSRQSPRASATDECA